VLSGQPHLEQVSERAQRRLPSASQLLGLRRQQSPALLGLAELTSHGRRALHRPA
jgi:hypothetical protein